MMKQNKNGIVRTLEFTGERFVPEEHGNIELEHLHRYMQARDIAAGKIVLDIASGEGYGSAMMAEVAQYVTGIDIAHDAVAHANELYSSDNLQFLQGSCASIPLDDNSVDLIVSFETIEHHEQHAEMMLEFKRVLRPDGLLLISNPDRYYYSDVPNYKNPYHVKELYEAEFKELLSASFKNTQYFGQRLVYGSVIFPENGVGQSIHYEVLDNQVKTESALPRPLYWVALASDSALPPLTAGIFEQDPINSEFLKDWKKELRKQSRLTAEESRIAELLREDLKNAHLQIETLVNSISWKVSLPLREMHRWIMTPSKQAKRYMHYGASAIKYGYKKFFFNVQTRAAHRRFLENNLPFLLQLFTEVPNVQMRKDARRVFGTPYKEVDWKNMHLVLPTSAQPVVSVIIPIYGKYNYTLRCLASIMRHFPETPFEVIVVDDCSPDISREVLSYVDGIRVVFNATNQGFIRSCNIGAAKARGNYLCFLNNDTEVTPGWLDALMHTFVQFPGTGLVGSKLVYPDGSLQEAGGIIWKDGSAWNFGRNQNQLDPAYSYAREVDYCSGASIVVPTVLFNELNGFDEHYLPAYCEDSDLALKIRDRGYRVLYQPLSVVVHYEGVTSGTSVVSGVKAFQVENMKKQFERWKDLLANYQDNGVDIDKAKDRTATRRVLVVDHCTPTPDQDAGSVIAFNLLLLLREMSFQVTFIPEHNFLYLSRYTEALQAVGIETIYRPYCHTVDEHVKTAGTRYDLVLMIRPGVIQRHLATVKKYCTNAKVLYHTVDLHYLRMQREAQLSQNGDVLTAAEKMKTLEFDSIKNVDASIVVSTAEQTLLKTELPGESVHVLPLIMDIPGTCAPFAQRKDIVFVGGYQHTPNVDAVLYFVSEVMPLLRLKLPGVRFFVVGSNVPSQIKALESEDVIVIGFVEELHPLLDRMRLAVAPLRYGAGIKGKVGTAMAVGLPVVATPLAAEGMGLTAGENILIADNADAFADRIFQIYTDESLWNNISTAGIHFAESAWGAQAAWKTLASILKSIDLPVKKSERPLVLWNYKAEERDNTRNS